MIQAEIEYHEKILGFIEEAKNDKIISRKAPRTSARSEKKTDKRETGEIINLFSLPPLWVSL